MKTVKAIVEPKKVTHKYLHVLTNKRVSIAKRFHEHFPEAFTPAKYYNNYKYNESVYRPGGGWFKLRASLSRRFRKEYTLKTNTEKIP